MDVAGIMRAFLGEAAPKEGKALELKPGQVVRALVVQLLGEREALLQVNGVPVRASLEMPVAPGQVSLFQVQPDHGSGPIVLKPLAASTAGIPAESLTELLRQFGVKDTPANRAVVRVLHEEGIPLAKRTVADVSQAVSTASAASTVSAAPMEAANGSAEEWIRAAAVAIKRGLPVSADSVRALHTTMLGPSPSELLAALERGARETLAAPQVGASVQQAAERLLQVLQRADALLGETLRPAEAAFLSGGARTAAPGGSAAPMHVQVQGTGAAPTWQGARPDGLAPVSAPSVSPLQGAQASAPPPASQAQPGAVAGSSPPQNLASVGGAAPAPASAAQSDAPAASAAEAPERPPLLSFLKLLGIDVERQWARLASGRESVPASELQPADPIQVKGSAESEQRLPREEAGRPPLPLPVSVSAAVQEDLSVSKANHPAETLKSALAQLAALEDTPPALKESAQTALQSITGQQLLLTPDRTAPLTHVTLFVPLPGKNAADDGKAAVHIHTRRGGKGELDANNCRLWFQLSLASLGETWVDVSITNRIVGLRIWNDHPASEPFFMKHKPAIEAAMQTMGYQLSTFRHTPHPPEQAGDQGMSAGGTVTAAYAPKTYKGVDYRI